ncbi:hypothetical protein IC582_009051 [Cucumis melo]
MNTGDNSIISSTCPAAPSSNSHFSRNDSGGAVAFAAVASSFSDLCFSPTLTSSLPL